MHLVLQRQRLERSIQRQLTSVKKNKAQYVTHG